MPGDHSVSGIKISSFDTAQNIKTSDLITGLQDRENKNFTFGTILAWFRQTIEDFYIAVSEKGRANGVASLDGAGKVTDTQIPFSSNNPLMDGAASAGTATTLSRSDHRHPSDTSKISTSEKGAASGVASLGSDGKVPSAQLPTIPSASSATPQNLGTAAAGSSTDYSRADHVHNKPSAADINAQPTITASGILKGDGQGGVSAATPGTDYATPNQIPTTPADIGALAADGTAVAAEMLSTEWYVSGNAGWYKFLEIDMAEAVEQLDVSATTLNLTLFICETRGDSLGRFFSGILQIRLNVNTNLNFVGGQIAKWGDFCANGVGSIPYTPNNIKYITDNSTKKATLYINKVSDNTGRITVSVLRRYARSSSVVIESGWRKNEAVAEVPSDALDALGPTAEYDTHGVSLDSRFQGIESAVLAKSRLVRFTAQAVSVASGAEIFRITDAEITTDTEVVSVEFANPSYITAGGSWASYAGYVAFTGTCTAATTADVILKI